MTDRHLPAKNDHLSHRYLCICLQNWSNLSFEPSRCLNIQIWRHFLSFKDSLEDGFGSHFQAIVP